MDGMWITNTKVGGQGSPWWLETGDWAAYTLDIDLPNIANTETKRVEIDISAAAIGMYVLCFVLTNTIFSL